MQNSVAKKLFALGSAAALALSLVPSFALAAAHSEGANFKRPDGSVCMIIAGQARCYSSAGAFLSYGFNSWSSVVDASSEDLALPQGALIPPQDGKVFCAAETKGTDTKGECSLVSGGQKFPFTSAAVFTGLGFKFSRAITGDSSFLGRGGIINNSTSAHLPGVLVNNNGTVQLVGTTGLMGIPDLTTFNSWGYSFNDVVPANMADKAMSQTGVMPARVAGQLSPTGVASMPNNTTTQSGPLTVSLASDNPVSNTIVAGQATADLLHFTVTGNGTLSSVVLTRTGISDQNTLSNVYLYNGVTRLTDGYSFNSNSQITINNLNLAVNGSVTLSVKADVYSSAPSGQTIAVSVTGVMASGQTAVSAVSVRGNLMSIGSGSTLAQIGISGSNQVAAATVNAGTTSYAIWRQAFQVNTRSLNIKAANFRVTGSAPSDALTNVGLFIDGVKAGNNANMVMVNGSNYLSFDLSAAPATLTTGNHTFEVRADVVKGSSYNFTVSLQQASDLMVYDPQVGVNVAVCGNTSCTATYSASAAGQITIGSGSLTFAIDPTFNTLTNVTGGASNTAIAKYKLHGYGEDVKVTSLSVTPVLSGTTPAAAGLQNVTLYFNGAQVGSQMPWTTGSLTFNLGSQMIVTAGQDSFLEVRADLRTSSSTNYTAGTVSATVNAGSGNGEGWNSKSSVAVPGSAVVGNSLTIQAGMLSVSKNSGYGSQTVNPNTPGSKIGSYILLNQSSSESVRVTTLYVGLTSDGTTVLSSTSSTGVSLSNFGALKTSETSGSGSTPQQPAASNTFSVDFTLAPGATKYVDILADTSSATGNVVTTLNVSAMGATSNTSITGSATGQTITLSAGTVATPTLLVSASTPAQFIPAGDPTATGVGAADASKASYTFVSTGGASTISELKFTISGTAASPVTSVKVGSVSAPVVSGVAWLQNVNLAVPNGGAGLQVDAYATYAPVGTSGVTPNTTAIVSLTYVKYTSGGSTATLTPSVAAPTMTMVGSVPTVTVNSTQATGLVVGGAGKLGEVTIAAGSKGSVKLNTIVFTLSASGFSTAPTTITTPYLADNGSTAASGVTCTAAGLVVTCKLDADANASLTNYDGYVIGAGTSKTFSLYGTNNGANTGSGIPIVSASVGSSTFSWDDTSTNGASGTNLAGTLIYNFPTTSYSIKQ